MRAAWASDPARSRGRVHRESPATERSEFGRDRDRIIHSTAFRRLEYKTQVFVNHEGDLFRTRLTHSIEVAQIARSIARALGADEDLTEAIALAHDLGHTPFGHAGQDALDECMRAFGGFEHNLQSLRVVDLLEERYGAFDGLNLSFETREGILKHCSKRNAEALGELGRRFLKNTRPSIEAQIANLADEIAYNNHDVDDGLRAELLTIAQLVDVPLFAEHHATALKEFPEISGRRLVHETVRRMINALIVDLIQATRAQLSEHAPRSVEDVRRLPALVAFSPRMAERSAELKTTLLHLVYRHYRVVRMTTKARRVIRELFDAFAADARMLPTQYQVRALDSGDIHRTIADYIAGMTDRFAMREHQRLFDIDVV